MTTPKLKSPITWLVDPSSEIDRTLALPITDYEIRRADWTWHIRTCHDTLSQTFTEMRRSGSAWQEINTFWETLVDAWEELENKNDAHAERRTHQ